MSMLTGTKRALLGKHKFNPRSILGLQLWLRADIGLWQDSVGGTAAASDADVVGAWADQSGNANDATQGTAAKKPLLKTGIVNGRPVVRFDGADDWLQTGTFARSIPSHMFAVVQQISWTISEYLWDAADAINKLFVRQRTTTPTLAMYTGAFLLNSSLAVGAFGILSCLYNGVSSVFRINGNEQTGDTGALTGDGITIGALQNSATPSNCDFAEILIYNAALSDADRGSVERYLASKYGITLA